MTGLAIEAVFTKRLGAFTLDISLAAGDGTLALFGASGSGKSMTLRGIAGIERPDAGRIEVDGVTLFDSGKRIDLPPQARRTGLLFQNYALFPNMTVAENLRAGIRRERDRRAAEERMRRMAASFGLTDLLTHMPHQLSGGQQQRVALARILVGRPRILMLDEPFSALDPHLRGRLEQEVRQVAQSFGGTVLFVSHDIREAYRMSDRIAVLENGRVVRTDEKQRLFDAPATLACAELTGCENVSACKPLGGGRVIAADWDVPLAVRAAVREKPLLCIRAHAITPGEGENTLRCRVCGVIEDPFTVRVSLRPVDAAEGTRPLVWELDKRSWAALSASEVTVSLPADAILGLTR